RSLSRHFIGIGAGYRVPYFDDTGRLLALRMYNAEAGQDEGVAILDWPSGRELARYGPRQYPAGFDSDGSLWTFGTGRQGLLRWPRSVSSTPGGVRYGPPEQVLAGPGIEVRGHTLDGQHLILTHNQIPAGAIILHSGNPNCFVATGNQYDVR